MHVMIPNYSIYFYSKKNNSHQILNLILLASYFATAKFDCQNFYELKCSAVTLVYLIVAQIPSLSDRSV